MAGTYRKIHDGLLDQYFDTDKKVILMALHKHGSSTITNAMEDTTNSFTLAPYMPDYDHTDHAWESIHSFRPQYKEFDKYITYRDFESVWISAFCYETRTSHFKPLLQGTKDEVKEKVYDALKAAGGVDVFCNQDFKSMNGTYMSICYASTFPAVADQIVEECTPVDISHLPNFLSRFVDGDIKKPQVNKTSDESRIGVTEAFDELHIMDALKEKYESDYMFKEKLKEKLSA